MRAFAVAASMICLAAGCSSGAPVGGHTGTPAPDAGDEAGHDVHEAGTSDAARVDAAHGGPADGGGADMGSDVDTDAGTPCSIDGEPGECMDVSACAAMSGYQSTPGYCPGPASIECCALVPNVADNPPIPAGYELMAQADVTPAMTTWAVAILHDPTTYPLFSTTTMSFGSLLVLARVEWHPPDFNNSAVHRGVTLYQHL